MHICPYGAMAIFILNKISLLEPKAPNRVRSAYNNRLTGAFSSINPYREKLFLLIPSGRVLSGIFSVIITSAWGSLGVYQELFQPDIGHACWRRSV
jgi:hypothetical protein